jgi:hypothetical protein
VIATAAPAVADVGLNPQTRQFRITFRTEVAMQAADLLNPSNYSLILPSARVARSFSLGGLALDPTDPNTVLATFDVGGKSMRGGYVLRIHSLGIEDIAGNVMVERTFTDFPGVNPPPGSDFVAQITTNGQSASGPLLYIPRVQRLAALQHGRFLRGKAAIRR